MPTKIENFTVDAASDQWVPGPTGVKITQSLTIDAAGSVIGLGSPAHYVEVEGSYPLDNYPPNHVLSPGDFIHVDYLIIFAVKSGDAPTAVTSDRSLWQLPRWTLKSDGVTRTTRLYPSDFANKVGDSDAWDIYFGFADTFYGDNSGTISVTTYVTDVDLQPAGLVSLPGHISQDDIDSAAFCSFSGLLTPGNRQRASSDNRTVADIFAPYRKAGPKEF